MTSEAAIQNEIRRDHSHGKNRLFRQNVGVAWTGDVHHLRDGSVLIKNPRPFHAGFEGLADLGGWTSVTVTPEMVGRLIAVYVALEVKSRRGVLKEEQRRFLALVHAAGGIAGVCRSSADAEKLLSGVDMGLTACFDQPAPTKPPRQRTRKTP